MSEEGKKILGSFTIRNYLMGETKVGQRAIIIGNDDRPVLQEVTLGAVWERLLANHNWGIANRERIRQAKIARPPLGQKARAAAHKIKLIAKWKAWEERNAAR